MRKNKILHGILAVFALCSMTAMTACDDVLGSLEDMLGIEIPIGNQGPGDKHECVWSEWSVVVEATCETDGEEKRVCQENELHEEKRPISALGHDVETHEAKSATCEEVGWKAYETCSRDGCEYTTYEEIGALSHDVETHEAKSATCEEVGWKAYETCKRDGCDYTTYEEIGALSHDIQTHEAKSANCEEVGWKAYETCKRDGCNYTTYEEIGALSHDIQTHEAQSATCKEVGWKAYETCKRDGCEYTTYEEIGLVGHKFSDGFCETCSLQDPNYKASVGLKFILSSDKTYYTVSGIGTCTDTHIVIPDTYKNLPVKAIGASAFKNEKTFKGVTLPETLETIGKEAFRNCASLLSVVLPDSVTSVGEYAFFNCYNLVHVTVGKKVTTISYQSFENCYKLLEVCNKSALDVSILSVASYAKRIYAPEQGKSYLSMDENGYVFYTEGSEKIFVAYSGEETSLKIPEGVTSIYQSAFRNNTSLKSVEVPNTLTSIGYNAFNGCYNLQKKAENGAYYLGNSSNTYVALLWSYGEAAPIINANTKVIADYAFYGGSSFTEIDIPEGVISIGECAFYGCALKNVAIPDSVTKIGIAAFSQCISLESVVIPDSVSLIANGTFSYCKSLKEVTIGKNVTSIGASAFYSCYALESLTIPDSVKTIGDNAFNFCKALEKVTIGKGVEVIGREAFDGCAALKGVYITDVAAWCEIEFASDDSNPVKTTQKLYVNNQLLTNLVVPEGVTKISRYAFNNCQSLVSVVIPSTVTTIQSRAFGDCTNLMTVELGENVSMIENSAFIYNLRLLEIYNKSALSITLKSDANGYVAAFAKNIYTPTKGASKISTDANGFVIYTDGESKLLVGYRGSEKHLVLPEGITQIYDYAFVDCPEIESITMPKTVTLVGACAFKTSSLLTDVYYEGSETDWASITIKYDNNYFKNATRHYGE